MCITCPATEPETGISPEVATDWICGIDELNLDSLKENPDAKVSLNLEDKLNG